MTRPPVQLPTADRVRSAIQRAALTSTLLASRLGAEHPPADAEWGAALHYYGGPTTAFERWAAWSAIENLRPFAGMERD